MSERVIFVDKNDQIVGAGDRKEAWQKGYYTRNTRIVLRDQNGRFLSQQRTVNKDSFPNMWTVAAGGHVDEGETWEQAALRETIEELGISVKLHYVGEFKFKHDIDDKKIHQITRVYEGRIENSTKFTLQKSEVRGTRWYNLDELKHAMDQSANQFTPSFREVISKFY